MARPTTSSLRLQAKAPHARDFGGKNPTAVPGVAGHLRGRPDPAALPNSLYHQGNQTSSRTSTFRLLRCSSTRTGARSADQQLPGLRRLPQSEKEPDSLFMPRAHHEPQHVRGEAGRPAKVTEHVALLVRRQADKSPTRRNQAAAGRSKYDTKSNDGHTPGSRHRAMTAMPARSVRWPARW